MSETRDPTDSTDRSIPVDALIVGGGVQGLTLLREFTDRRYAAVLVTDAALGSGQTLHSHGILNSGYPFPDPDLRTSVEEDWLPFARERGVETYGADRFFAIVPPAPYERLTGAWEARGYPFEEVAPEALPPGSARASPRTSRCTWFGSRSTASRSAGWSGR